MIKEKKFTMCFSCFFGYVCREFQPISVSFEFFTRTYMYTLISKKVVKAIGQRTFQDQNALWVLQVH
jgi:hypothetical protein